MLFKFFFYKMQENMKKEFEIFFRASVLKKTKLCDYLTQGITINPALLEAVC